MLDSFQIWAGYLATVQSAETAFTISLTAVTLLPAATDAFWTFSFCDPAGSLSAQSHAIRNAMCIQAPEISSDKLSLSMFYVGLGREALYSHFVIVTTRKENNTVVVPVGRSQILVLYSASPRTMRLKALKGIQSANRCTRV